MDTDKDIIVCLGLTGGFLFGLMVFLLVLATSQTFGQRCNRIYPNNAVEQNNCVQILSKGDSHVSR